MKIKQKQNNLPLFDVRARRTHPASSHAECQRQTEELTASMQFALQWIRQYPGHTAKELERLAGCEPGQIWKVAAQLERRHLVVRRSEGSNPLKIYPV
jgi:DNA-binding MarR family transcriptional regulator